MRFYVIVVVFLVAGASFLSSCGDEARFPVAAGIGPHPELPPPHETHITTVNIAPARGMTGRRRACPGGLKVASFADNLGLYARGSDPASASLVDESVGYEPALEGISAADVAHCRAAS
jgi:hypothetical protein